MKTLKNKNVRELGMTWFIFYYNYVYRVEIKIGHTTLIYLKINN